MQKSYAISALDSDNIRIPELYLHHFIFRAMEKCGMNFSAIKRIKQYWGPMVMTGTPTLWEVGICEPNGKRAMNNIGSLCHGFGASPVSVIQRVLLGVYPLTPGFKEFSFSPHSCGMEFASGSIPTPNGDIRVKWYTDSNVINARLDVPQGLTAKLVNGDSLAAGTYNLTFNMETE